jgi:hypothetical protein
MVRFPAAALAAAILLAALLSVAFAASASALEWSLEQNDPNPYCSLYQAPVEIDFSAGSVAQALLVVWDSDSTEVVRTLFDSPVEPGLFSTTWDGRDEDGVLVPAGDYPYVLTATDLGSGAVVFAGSLVMEVNCCCSPTDPLVSWAKVKNLYRY